MLRARISQLKNDLSRYLRAVRAGHEVEVLDRDRPIARLVPLGGTGDAASREGQGIPYDDLVREGLLRPGTGKVPLELLRKLPPGRPGALAALLEERGENRR